MHPALATPELAQLICEKLQEPEPVCREGTLASLAVTCRALREPALDALWRTQRGIQNIIKCLPSHLWELREGLNTDPELEWHMTLREIKKGWPSLHIIGTIQPGDWTVPLSYSRRIKTLFISPFPAQIQVPDVTVFEAIASTLPTPLFFPKLRSLHCRTDEGLLPYMNLFLGTRMEFVHLDIAGDDFNDPVPSGLALQSLKRLHARGLFRLDGPTGSVLLCRPACDLIKQLDQIEDLSVPNVDREALERLARFTSLKALDLEYARPEFLEPAADG
ncbi:hypothetical protein FB45DRAFT_894875 [Roridomyces roridus]|uniref:F-box domain-containing protein n=1 Tax=Roridomyces roridus TaxID=1738132 RepID=A0AAD7CGL2_9AGAR|nr:hypothetical protein FB45DRAFT_894875 [Roridomyces roridus]